MSSSLYNGLGFGPTGHKPNTPTGQYGKPFKEKVPEGYKAGGLQQFTPEQMQLFQQSFGHVSPDSYTARLAGGDQGVFDQMEAPALRQFNEIQGNMASRFSGMGGGARRSSGFQNAGNQAASNFAQQLQSQRQGLQRQALQDLFSMSSDLMGQKPYERFLTKQPQGTSWASTIGSLGGFIPGAATSAFGGGSMQDAASGAINGFSQGMRMIGGA